MKAIRIHETGGPEVMQMEDVTTPVPQEGQVLIKVAVAGVNYTDIMQRQGIYMSRESQPRLPLILGSEVAGIIAAVGPGVTTLKEGMRVIALVNGGYAEYAIAPVNYVVPIPDTLDFTHAVAFLVQGITAYQLLNDCADLQEGESVLVHSAAGGVGVMAIQVARASGAKKVIATASNDEKLYLASQVGADVAINYTQADWTEQVLAATNQHGADVILEAVGGDIAEKSLLCLAPFGRMGVYGVASKRFAPFAGTQLMHKNQTVFGYWLTTQLQNQERIHTVLTELINLFSNGAIRPLVRDIFPLAHAADAHRAISERKTVGKVVLLV